MLFTRCPHCNTTFRITEEALNKARGQVRCGRCVNIFDAHAQLRETADEVPDGAASETGVATEETAVPPAAAIPQAAETPADAGPDAAPPESRPDAEPAARATQAADDGLPDDTLDGVDAESAVEIELSSEAETADDEPESIVSAWRLEDTAASEPGHRRAWTAAAALALLALIGQLTHHFRSEFANQPLIGPIVQAAYAALGAPVAPRWDIEQYRILDWVATAEPNPNGPSDLAIRARIQNRGPAAQPFPHVLVRLKDRWETAIGARVFAPREYLATAPRGDAGALMPPGDTASAALTLVDPGPDAYGFELDVCIEYGAQQLRCATDRVFR